MGRLFWVLSWGESVFISLFVRAWICVLLLIYSLWGLVFARGLGYPGSRLRLRRPWCSYRDSRVRGSPQNSQRMPFGKTRTCVGELARGSKPLRLAEFAPRSAPKMRGVRPTPTDAERRALRVISHHMCRVPRRV